MKRRNPKHRENLTFKNLPQKKRCTQKKRDSINSNIDIADSVQ